MGVEDVIREAFTDAFGEFRFTQVAAEVLQELTVQQSVAAADAGKVARDRIESRTVETPFDFASQALLALLRSEAWRAQLAQGYLADILHPPDRAALVQQRAHVRNRFHKRFQLCVLLAELNDFRAIAGGSQTRFDTFEAIDCLIEAPFQAFKR